MEMDATDEAVMMQEAASNEEEEGPTPRHRFHEQLRAREAKKKTPHERQNRLKKKKMPGEGRRRRTELDHCASNELVAERFETKKRFECWRCVEPKESRILYKWHVVASPAATEEEEEGEGEEEPPGQAQTSVKTICLGCYGHLLSLRKGRDAPAPASRELLEPQPDMEMAEHQQPQRRGGGGGHGEGVATDQAGQIPTLRAPHPHKRREKKHARVSYVTPKGMRGGRGRGRGAPQTAGSGQAPTHGE